MPLLKLGMVSAPSLRPLTHTCAQSLIYTCVTDTHAESKIISDTRSTLQSPLSVIIQLVLPLFWHLLYICYVLAYMLFPSLDHELLHVRTMSIRLYSLSY